MIDLFFTKDVKNLLQNKNIVFMGDSNVRALYKDLLCLMQNTCFISSKSLKKKGESSCFGDELVYLGPRYNGREYKEERRKIFSHKNKETSVSFYFICRVFDSYVDDIIHSLTKDQRNLPDILIINSCLWDITRWGPGGVENYKKDLPLLMKKLKSRLPDCLVIWITAPPISCEIKGGFLVKEIEFLRYSIRFHVMEANQYARKVVVDHGFDVVDSHYHLKLQIHKRSGDGIHWEPDSIRYITNLLLTHISLALNVPLPHNRLEENSVSNSEDNDLKPKQENNPSKVSSVIIKSNDYEEFPSSKVQREEFVTPPVPKKQKPSLKEKDHNSYNQSHHSYLKREENKVRRNRNRKKNKSNKVSNGPVLLQDQYDFSSHGFSYSNHQDSGYISSPNPAPINTYGPRTVIDNSRFTQSSPSYYQNIPRVDNNWSQPLPHSPYSYASNNNPPLSSYAGDLRQVLGWSSRPNYSPVDNALQVKPMRLHANYQFQLQPVIDFASTNALPFGIQF